tara:strand:+ start:41 stop:307 length:267 start_codon:yes stop_codon:yes gene_type:complete
MKNKKLYISENCVSEKLDDELIILDLKSGLYHSLNEIGSIIWEEIKNKNPSYDDLIGSISQKYIGENISKDSDLFLEKLKEKRLIYLK